MSKNSRKKIVMPILKKIPLHVSIHLRYLYQDRGVRGKQLLQKYPMYSRTSIYRHAKKPITAEPVDDNRHRNKGRPSKVSARDKRAIFKEIPRLRESVGSFTCKRIRIAAGVESDVCDETIRNVLRAAGYGYRHSRKKGLLTKEDLQKRLRFCRKVKRVLSDTFWRDGIGFYLDGVGFVHKRNPHDEAKSTRTMAWRRPHEGLQPNCTAKGSHVGFGGKVCHFIVAIAYGKGVVLSEQYSGNINADMFAQFVLDNFPDTFERSANPQGKLFLQDGDPSQNSRKAKNAIDAIGARKFDIPPRSPDMNPIENVFNNVKMELHKQALEQNIKHETLEQFSSRVKTTLENFPSDVIDRTIDTMDKRMMMVIKAKGKRIKY